jgi:agmatine deiminase
MSKIPKSCHYTMPPEWNPHACTFLEWPARKEIWHEHLTETYKAYGDVARAIAKFEPVVMIVNKDTIFQASHYCGPEVQLLEIPHDDSWMRDNGPTFLINQKGELAGINWKFNAWGEKYYPFENDNQVAFRLLKKLNIPCFDAPIILEGGSIHVDGEGTLLTTEECLLNPNRNPHLSKEDIESVLMNYLNVEKIIWLKKGLYGDETDGHVDNIACFAKPGTILIQTCKDPSDPNYDISKENIEILKHSTDAKGRSFEIIEIEQPPAMYEEGQRLSLSYINFYFTNGGIVVPVFGGICQEADENALNILQGIFPDRKIVPVNGLPIVRGGGNIHCITQQMPAGNPYMMMKEVI